MRLRQLFEAKDNTVAIIFGRFNPPHKGHRAAWEMASESPYWYVGTNRSTQGPKDPLPFDVKVEAMKAIWPEVAGHIIAETSWLTLASKVYAEHGGGITLLCLTDEDWVTKTVQQYNGKEGAHGYYNFKRIDQKPTPRLSSATALRAAVQANDRQAFADAAGVPADTLVAGHPFFDVVAHFLSQQTAAPKKVAKKKKEVEPVESRGARVVPGGDNPDAIHPEVQRGDRVVVQDPDNIATVHSGTVKRIGREFVYVVLKNGEVIAVPYDEVSKDYETLSKRAHKILNKKGPSMSRYKVDEKTSTQGKFEKHLKKHGYDVGEKSKYWDQKLKDIDAQIAAWDKEMEQRKQGIKEDSEKDEYVQTLSNEFIRRAKLGRHNADEGTIFRMLDKFFDKFNISDYYFDNVLHHVLNISQSDQQTEDKDPCWKGYRQLGMKKKGGKQVPNCVPEDAAGVGIITKQNTTKDVNKGTLNKMLKAFHLTDSISLDEGVLTTDIAHALKRYGEHASSPDFVNIGKLFGTAQITQALLSIRKMEPEKKRLALKIMAKAGGLLGKGIAKSLEETYDGDAFYEAYGVIEETLEEAEYQGRKVQLGKPMQGDVKKFKVYVKDPSTGNVKKVNFGDPNMRIKKSNPERRKSFRARHNCDNPGPRTKARYWSCRKW